MISTPRTILLLACLLILGCRRTSEYDTGLIITHQISPQPPKVGPATVTLNLSDKAGAPISGAKITLEGNMSHPGMPPVVSQAPETDAGQYRGPLDFKMAGDWIITVRITLADGKAVTRDFEVSEVRPE